MEISPAGWYVLLNMLTFIVPILVLLLILWLVFK